MSFILLGDLHLNAYAGADVTSSGQNQSLLDIVAAMDAALQDAIARRAAIIQLGDVFHDRKAVKSDALHAAGEWLRRVQEAGVELHILTGNHDLSVTGDGSSSTSIIHGCATVHTRPGVVEIQGTKVGFLPYMTAPEGVRQCAKLLKKDGATVLVGHIGIGDPKFADCLPTDYEAPGRINVSDLIPEHFEQIFLGHYHNAQQLTENLRYVGTPLQLSYKEAGQDKGWCVWSPGKDVEVIPNTVSPRFHKAEVDALHPPRPGDHVWEEVETKDEADELRRELSARGLHVRVDVKPRESTAAARIDTKSNATLCASYISAIDPAMPPDKKKRLTEAGIKLLQESA